MSIVPRAPYGSLLKGAKQGAAPKDEKSKPAKTKPKKDKRK